MSPSKGPVMRVPLTDKSPYAKLMIFALINGSLYFNAWGCKTWAPWVAKSHISSTDISSNNSASSILLGSVDITPSTSVTIITSLASKQCPIKNADTSLPPRPRVVISPLGPFPKNPQITGIIPWFKSSSMPLNILLVVAKSILASKAFESVMIGHNSLYGSMNWDFTPNDSTVAENNLELVNSPIAIISAFWLSVKLLPIASFDKPIRSSVVLLTAETTTTTCLPFIYSFTTDWAAFLILEPSPTDVPPNFATIKSINIHTYFLKLFNSLIIIFWYLKIRYIIMLKDINKLLKKDFHEKN